jgi:hypothetical protein
VIAELHTVLRARHHVENDLAIAVRLLPDARTLAILLKQVQPCILDRS